MAPDRGPAASTNFLKDHAGYKLIHFSASGSHIQSRYHKFRFAVSGAQPLFHAFSRINVRSGSGGQHQVTQGSQGLLIDTLYGTGSHIRGRYHGYLGLTTLSVVRWYPAQAPASPFTPMAADRAHAELPT